MLRPIQSSLETTDMIIREKICFHNFLRQKIAQKIILLALWIPMMALEISKRGNGDIWLQTMVMREGY